MNIWGLVLLMTSTCLMATPQPYDCNFKGVRSIELPLYPERQDSPTFNYKFQIIGDLDPEKLVILDLPGGPGGTRINDYEEPHVLAAMNKKFPESVPKIFFDPRTSGCNYGKEDIFPDDSLTSWYLAGDVIGVIKALGLKKYIIHGISYGTQWATFVAARASGGEVDLPQSVVLSGVLGLGKADGSFDTAAQLVKEWKALKKDLSPEVIRILEEDSPLGYKSSLWVKLITWGLREGFQVLKGKYRHWLADELESLISSDENDRAALIFDLTNKSPSYGVKGSSDRLWKLIDCHEYSPHDGGVRFQNGELLIDPSLDDCEEKDFDRPYDSAKLLIKAPIYYVAGTNDPAAPYEGAFYHFEHQTKSHRNFVKVPGGGHNPVSNIFPDCIDKIWEAIMQKKDLTDVLPSCKAPVELLIEDAQN